VGVAPIDLFGSCLRLLPGGEIRTRADAGAGDGWRLTAVYARTGADVDSGRWQAHPESEKLVSCLVGMIRLHLRPERPGEREEEIRLTAGTAVVVPRGRWHRIEPDIPSNVLIVAPARGTLSAPATQAGAAAGVEGGSGR
jgi:Cupin domain.